MKNIKNKDWALIAGEAGLFFIVIMVLWLDEFVDMPYRLLGAPQTPYRPQEYILETVSVLVVAIVTIAVTMIVLRRARRLEKFLRVCAWCRKVWVDDKWVNFEEYALKHHSLKSSHGICEECVTKIEQKRVGKAEGLTNNLPNPKPKGYRRPLQ
jgi:hypothetical protein